MRLLCPTERLLYALKLDPGIFIQISLLIIPVLVLLYRYGFLSIRVTIIYIAGVIIIINLVFGFKYYGDRIHEVAKIIEHICKVNKLNFLETIYSSQRLYVAILLALIALIIILEYASSLPILHKALWSVGSTLIGFMTGDAISGVFLYSRAIARNVIQNSYCRVLDNLYRLDKTVTIALGLLFQGSLLTLLVLIAIPFIVDAQDDTVIKIRFIGLSIVTPALILTYLYPLHSLWLKAIHEKEEKIEKIENKIRMLMHKLEKSIEQESDEVDTLIKQINALKLLKEHYMSIKTFPLTNTQIIETITTSLIPWISLIAEVIKDLVL